MKKLKSIFTILAAKEFVVMARQQGEIVQGTTKASNWMLMATIKVLCQLLRNRGFFVHINIVNDGQTYLNEYKNPEPEDKAED